MALSTSLILGINIPAGAAYLTLENVGPKTIRAFDLTLTDGRRFQSVCDVTPGGIYYELMPTVADESSTDVEWVDVTGDGWGVGFAPRYRAFTPGSTTILFVRGEPEQLIALLTIHKGSYVDPEVARTVDVPEPGTLTLLGTSLLLLTRFLKAG